MIPETPNAPPQNVRPIEEAAGGLFGRPWYLYFAAISRRLGVLRDAVMGWASLSHQGRLAKVTSEGTIGETAFADADVVLGAPNLTNAGAIPKVSSTDGTLEESAVTDDGSDVTVLNRLLKVRRAISGANQPTVMIDSTATAKVRHTRITTDVRADWLVNLSFDGSDFNLDDTGKPGLRIALHETIGFRVTYYPAGANPVTATAVQTLLVDTVGDEDIPGVYKVAGTQVVGARGAALTASGAAVGAAPALYNQAYEQTLANLANNLKTRVDELENRLGSATGHGLFT